MKHCNACRVNVDSLGQHCPLCYTMLKTVDDSPAQLRYPIIKSEAEQYQLLIKILAFISISVIVVSITINLLTAIKFPWSFILTLSIVYAWWAFSNALKKHQRLGYNLMIQLISLAVLLFIFSKLLDFELVFFNYILPVLAASALLCFDILVIIRRQDFKNIFIYFLVVAILSFLPIVLYWLDIIKVVWPAASCAVYSIISFFGILIFEYNTTKNEFKKRFHL